MRDTAAGLLIGALGGLVFWLIGIPAPWLAGSMLAAIVAIFSGVKVGMPDWLRAMSFIFLGIQTGTSVTWDTVDRAAQWPLSIAFLGLTVVFVTWACTAYYVKRSGWDAATALFASLPGALSLVLLLASSTKADMRRVTIAQCIRLFFLVAALPTLISWMSPASAYHAGPGEIGSMVDILLLIAVSAAAGYALEWMRVPAGLMLGPMLASAGLELSGVISGTAPAFVLPDRAGQCAGGGLDHQRRLGPSAGADAARLCARRTRCHDDHGLRAEPRPGLCRRSSDGALYRSCPFDAAGNGLCSRTDGCGSRGNGTCPALKTQGPLMDQLAFLLTYKGAVVLGTLAVLLVADVVALFAILEFVGIRRLQADRV